MRKKGGQEIVIFFFCSKQNDASAAKWFKHSPITRKEINTKAVVPHNFAIKRIATFSLVSFEIPEVLLFFKYFSKKMIVTD